MTNGYNDILKKFEALKLENSRLKEEIVKLRHQLCIDENWLEDKTEQLSILNFINESAPGKTVCSSVTQISTSSEKVNLFMSLFKARNDVFARRWENPKKRYCRIFACLCQRMA